MSKYERAAGAERRVLYGEGQGGFRSVGLRRFKKDAIRAGDYIHPETGARIAVTPERMDRWVRNFAEMKSAGIRAPFPYDHSDDSARNAGFVEEMFREGDTLFVVVEVPEGEHAERIGKTIREVSVSITPNFVDGTGREWGEVIDHVAPCTRPVVAGQGNFVELPVAARLPSGGGVRAAVYRRGKEKGMLDMEKLAVLLGVAPEAVAEDPLGQIEAKLRSLQEEAERLRRENAAMAKADSGSPDAAERFEAALRTSPEAMAVAAELRRVNEELADAKIESYLRSGKLTPAMVEAGHAKALLLGQRIRLSAHGEEMPVREAFEAFLEHLPANACLDLSERAGRLRDAERPAAGAAPSDEEAGKLAQENLRLVGRGNG